jgi:hypothetical protein
MLVRACRRLTAIVGISVAAVALMLPLGPAKAADIGVLTFSNAQLSASAPSGIPISSFSLNANIGSASTGAGAGRASVRELTVTLSKPSQALMQMAMTGAHIAAMKLVANGITYSFKDVAVARVSESSGGRGMSQTIEFAFAAMEDSSATPAPPILREMRPMTIIAPSAATPTKSP